jgi:hypothetical protein
MFPMLTIGGVQVPFYSGGSGTILSRGALRRLGDEVGKNASLFNNWNTFADGTRGCLFLLADAVVGPD